MDADAGPRARAVRRQRGHGPPRARTQRRRRVARASSGRAARPLATHREWAPHDDRRARARVLVPEWTRRLERAVALPRRDDIRRAHAQPRAPASRVGRFRLAVAGARDQPARRARSRGGSDPRAARAGHRRDLVPGHARIDRAVEARDHRRLGPRRPRRSLHRVRVRHRGASASVGRRRVRRAHPSRPRVAPLRVPRPRSPDRVPARPVDRHHGPAGVRPLLHTLASPPRAAGSSRSTRQATEPAPRGFRRPVSGGRFQAACSADRFRRRA